MRLIDVADGLRRLPRIRSKGTWPAQVLHFEVDADALGIEERLFFLLLPYSRERAIGYVEYVSCAT